MILDSKQIFKTILSATNKLVDFVAPTYGPVGNNVIIKRFGRIQAVDDGHLIADEFTLEDPSENDIVEFIRQANRETNKRVEDGNVTTLLLVKALLNGIGNMTDDIMKNFVSDLKTASESAKKQLLDSAVKITTKEQIADVAKIAFNNRELASIIADAVLDVGEDGVILTEIIKGTKVYSEKVLGVKFDRGYVSSHFTNDDIGDKCSFYNPLILITDRRLTTYNEAKFLLDYVKLHGDSRPLVIVADGITDNALNIIVQNKVRGYGVVAIDAPEIGERKKDFLMDLCALTGATLVSIDKKIEEIDMGYFGGSDKIDCLAEETTIIGGHGDVSKRVEQLKERLTGEITDEQTKRTKKSIASLLGGIVIIKIGGQTDIEVNSHMPKVRNAVSSARLAFKSGVVDGAGVALARVKTGNDVLDNALGEPRRVLAENCEDDFMFPLMAKVKNFSTGEVGYGIDVGVIDPVETLCACIDSAVSIVSLLVKSKGLINNSN